MRRVIAPDNSTSWQIRPVDPCGGELQAVGATLETCGPGGDVGALRVADALGGFEDGVTVVSGRNRAFWGLVGTVAMDVRVGPGRIEQVSTAITGLPMPSGDTGGIAIHGDCGTPLPGYGGAELHCAFDLATCVDAQTSVVLQFALRPDTTAAEVGWSRDECNSEPRCVVQLGEGEQRLRSSVDLRTRALNTSALSMLAHPANGAPVSILELEVVSAEPCETACLALSAGARPHRILACGRTTEVRLSTEEPRLTLGWQLTGPEASTWDFAEIALLGAGGRVLRTALVPNGEEVQFGPEDLMDGEAMVKFLETGEHCALSRFRFRNESTRAVRVDVFHDSTTSCQADGKLDCGAGPVFSSAFEPPGSGCGEARGLRGRADYLVGVRCWEERGGSSSVFSVLIDGESWTDLVRVDGHRSLCSEGAVVGWSIANDGALRELRSWPVACGDDTAWGVTGERDGQTWYWRASSDGG